MRSVNGLTTKAGKVLFALILVGILVPTVSSAQTRMGVTGSAGAGLFVAADEDYYMDLGVDLYPEMGLQLDVSLIRLGLKVGLIYRKEERFEWYWDPYWDESYYDEYTLAFLPVQAEFLVAPLDAMSKDNLISPYVGFMGGVYIPIGDNDDAVPAFSFKLGSELQVDPLVAYGDIRYTIAPTSDPDHLDHRGDFNAGGVMIVAGLGLRLDFSKK